jgi:hypothetical protein
MGPTSSRSCILHMLNIHGLIFHKLKLGSFHAPNLQLMIASEFTHNNFKHLAYVFIPMDRFSFHTQQAICINGFCIFGTC